MVVIDPRSRDVLALVGGDEAEYGFNRALRAVRQPGSAFKPITYALAIESGKYTPATMVLDAPEVFDKWKPDNFETWSYAGAVRLARGGRAIDQPGRGARDERHDAQRAWSSSRASWGSTTELDPSLALALGASGVKPIELVECLCDVRRRRTLGAVPSVSLDP